MTEPVIVSDLTAPAVLGMTPRAFREAVKRHGIPFRKLGKRTLVRLEDLAPARATSSDVASTGDGDAHDGANASKPATSDDMLRALGFVA